MAVAPPAPEQFGVTEEPDRSWVKSSLTAHPLKSFNDHLRLTDAEIVSRFPRTHIHCGHGGRLERVAQRALARRPSHRVTRAGGSVVWIPATTA
jgi:hypothetical protein